MELITHCGEAIKHTLSTLKPKEITSIVKPIFTTIKNQPFLVLLALLNTLYQTPI